MKWLISLVLFIVSTSAYAQESLRPVPSTGKAYTILINEASLNGATISTGDSVAVFDGDLSVGASEFQGDFPLVISAWEGDASQNLDGFEQGNTMTIKVKSTVYDSVIVYEPSVMYEEGDGTFGYGAFTSLNLSHQTTFSPDISINSTNLDFGSVRRGDQVTKEFTITNTGDAVLDVYSVDSDDSQIVTDFTNGKIPVGASKNVTVTYSPTSENPINTTLEIISSDPDNGIATVYISGQGLPALAPVLSMEPNSYMLGNIKLGEVLTKKARVYNRGNDTLRVSSVSSSDINVLTVEMEDLNIPSGEFSEINFTVQPNTVGQNSARIEFQSNGASESATSVPVSWIGYEGLFESPVQTGLPYTVIINRITVDNQLPAVGSEIALMDGDNVVGLGVYTGDLPISVTAWQENTQQGLDGFTPGDSISARINTSKYNQQLDIGTDTKFERGDGTYGHNSFSVVELNGITGLAPTVTVDKSPLIFEDLTPGNEDTLRKWIFNIGDQDLEINSVNTTGNFFVSEVGSYTLASGDSTYVDIVFRANSTGINDGVFNLSTNDPFNSIVEISLRGRALIELPEERVSLVDSESQWLHSPLNSNVEASLTFENNFARSEEINFTIENSNDVTLNQNSVILEGNERTQISMNLTGTRVGADSLQLVLNYQDGSRQEIELYHLTYEKYFEEVIETGEPYSLILNLNEPGDPYRYGDQIAVFDGDQIVGFHVWKGSNSNIPVTAWKANSTNGLPGFVNGGDISFKVYKHVNGIQEAVELEPFSSSFSSDGKFGSGAYQVATIEADEPVYFEDPLQTIYFRENQFSATTFASLDTLVRDPNGQSITHTFSSDTTSLVASKFANFYRLQLEQEFYGEVNISHLAETESSTAHDTTTFVIMDEPEFQSSESHDVFVGDSTSIALYDVKMPRALTQTAELLNEGYADLQVIGNSLSVKVLKEGLFYVDVNVKDNYGFDLTKRISFTARYKKPWISTQMDTLRFDTTFVSRSNVSLIELDHKLPVGRDYSVLFEKGEVFSSNTSEISMTENGLAQLEITFSPDSERDFSDTLYLIYDGFETDTSYALSLRATGLTLPDPSATLSIGSLSFGDVKPGDNEMKSLTLTNTGLIDIQVDSASISESAFEVNMFPAALKPDSSLSIETRFSPSELGDYADSLRIYVKDMDALVVALDGRGAATVAGLEISELNFGDVKVGEDSEGILWLYNRGNLALDVGGLLLESEVFDAQLANNQVPAYDSVAVSATFSPLDVGEYTQELRLVVDSGSDTLSVMLIGMGYADPNASISTNQLSFGDVKPVDSKRKSLTVTNTGLIDIQVDSVSISESAFEVNMLPTVLKPDSSLSIETRFSPSELGDYTDSLRIYVKNMAPLVVALDGRGAAAIAGLEISELNFGGVKVGEVSEMIMWLYNRGNLALDVDDLLLESEVFDAQLANNQVPAYDSVAVSATFSPLDVGEYMEELRLIVGSGSDTLSVTLTGIGFVDLPPEPKVSFSKTDISFGEIFLTDQRTDTIIINNIGTVAIRVDSIKSRMTEFSYDFQSTIVEPDSVTNVTIKFQPNELRNYEDTIRIYIDKIPVTEIPVSGIGISAVAELSKSVYDFGDVSIGDSLAADIWLHNRGNVALIIEELILESDVFSAEVSVTEIAPQDSVTITTSFIPLSAINYEEQVLLKTNDTSGNLVLKLRGSGTSSVSVDGDGQTPAEFALDQNYPNPFNPTTTIKYSLPKAEDVSLVVYNLLGRQVATLVSKHQNAGVHSVSFDASQLATGIYIYRISAGKFAQTKKLMLVK